jgi:hypothetical protein
VEIYVICNGGKAANRSVGREGRQSRFVGLLGGRLAVPWKAVHSPKRRYEFSAIGGKADIDQPLLTNLDL